MMGSKWDIGRKQLEDTFSSKKFFLIFGLFLLMSVGSVHLGVGEFEDQLDRYESGEANFQGAVPEEPSLIEVFEFMASFNLPLAAGILAILLSYDSISKEREEGTIELLLSYPIYRDEVINGKFIAGLFTVALALLTAFVAASGYAIFRTGQLPALQEAARLGYMWIGSTVYMAFFYGLGILLSTIFRTSRRSLLAGMMILLISISTPVIAAIAADHVYTYDEQDNEYERPQPVEMEVQHEQGEIIESEPATYRGSDDNHDRRAEVRAQRQRFTEQVSRVSPSTSYQNFVGIIMGIDYETEFPPTLGESLKQSIDYLIFLLSQTILVFTLSYAVFMRQDL